MLRKRGVLVVLLLQRLDDRRQVERRHVRRGGLGSQVDQEAIHLHRLLLARQPLNVRVRPDNQRECLRRRTLRLERQVDAILDDREKEGQQAVALLVDPVELGRQRAGRGIIHPVLKFGDQRLELLKLLIGQAQGVKPRAVGVAVSISVRRRVIRFRYSEAFSLLKAGEINNTTVLINV